MKDRHRLGAAAVPGSLKTVARWLMLGVASTPVLALANTADVTYGAPQQDGVVYVGYDYLNTTTKAIAHLSCPVAITQKTMNTATLKRDAMAAACKSASADLKLSSQGNSVFEATGSPIDALYFTDATKEVTTYSLTKQVPATDTLSATVSFGAAAGDGMVTVTFAGQTATETTTKGETAGDIAKSLVAQLSKAKVPNVSVLNDAIEISGIAGNQGQITIQSTDSTATTNGSLSDVAAPPPPVQAPVPTWTLWVFAGLLMAAVGGRLYQGERSSSF